jgi:putative ABC transport system ATP-binding protein
MQDEKFRKSEAGFVRDDDSLVRVEGLSKSYRIGDSAVPVLRDVSLQVARGEFIAIMGASGSGKSTLLHVLGLLDRYDHGRYLLNGLDTHKLKDSEAASLRNLAIGFVFQSFHLLPQKKAWENVALPLRYRGASAREQRARAHALLERLGLGHRAEHRPNELSGGQRQRVAIARALVTDPPLILADEPTGNLDSEASDEVLALLREVHGEGRTVILVTHEHDVAQSAQRIIHVRDGSVLGAEPGPVGAA